MLAALAVAELDQVQRRNPSASRGETSPVQAPASAQCMFCAPTLTRRRRQRFLDLTHRRERRDDERLDRCRRAAAGGRQPVGEGAAPRRAFCSSSSWCRSSSEPSRQSSLWCLSRRRPPSCGRWPFAARSCQGARRVCSRRCRHAVLPSMRAASSSSRGIAMKN